jgi:DeoR family galactitol utilization operon repressor
MVGLSARESEIVELLKAGGEIAVSTLSDHLGVSSVTIRSDLRSLAAKGVIVRTRGGAMTAYHPLLAEKQSTHVEIKEKIAKAAADLVSDGDQIMISNGTTNALIVRYLLGKRDVHIVSNSTLLVPYVRVNPNIKLTLVGGEFRPSAEALVGSAALLQLQEYHVNYMFTGTDGLTLEQGLTTHLMENAEIVRQMWRQSTVRVLVADSSKFGNHGFVKILPLSDINIMITDDGLDAQVVARIRDMGVQVIIV